jgi:flagellar biosynthesis protein FlhB
MTVRDTITITDSLSCRFIVLEREQVFTARKVLPVDSLWNTTVISQSHMGEIREISTGESYLESSLILLFIIITLFFFREILNTIPSIFKSLLSHKEHVRLEEKLSASTQRNITALIAALFFPIFLTITIGDTVSAYSGIPGWLQFVFGLGLVIAYWVFKSLVLKFLGWITKNKHIFNLIGKIGYNHLIMAAIFSTPILLSRFFIPELEFSLFYKLLIYCIVLIYVLYLIRVYQTIIINRFSHIFYIVYLCSVELLPIALFANFLLSYQ